MLPLALPALFALAQPLAEVAGSAIAGLFGGDDPASQKVGARVAQSLVSAAAQVSGATIANEHDARNAAQAISLDPEKLAEFRRIVGEQVVALIRLDNEDRASARSQTVELAKAGSKIAWGAPVVSVIVLATFGLVMGMVLTKSIPPGQESTVNLMLGTLQTMATAVVFYWVGSSAGSAAKDKLLRGR